MTRVITTEPLAVGYDEKRGFQIAPAGTICTIEHRFDDGVVDLRTMDGETIPSVTPEQYEVDE